MNLPALLVQADPESLSLQFRRTSGRIRSSLEARLHSLTCIGRASSKCAAKFIFLSSLKFCRRLTENDEGEQRKPIRGEHGTRNLL